MIEIRIQIFVYLVSVSIVLISSIENDIKDSAKCKLEPEKGQCLIFSNRYFYNTTSKQCEEFTYSGCDGNDNNFEKIEQCEEECGGDERKLVVLDVENEDLDKKKENNSSETSKIDICQLKLDPGPCEKLNSDPDSCKKLKPSYYFNNETESCEEFIYEGCNGNENRFQTRLECNSRCNKNVTYEELCLSSLDKGYFCYLDYDDDDDNDETIVDKELFKRRFYYNSDTRKCHPFYYRGCGGNENRFYSRSECMHSCVDSKL